MNILEEIGLYEEKNEYKLFVDMDGVLCDWEKAFVELGPEITKGLEGQEYEDKYGRDELWKIISDQGRLEFWSEMPWMKDGKDLWNYVKKFNPTILTTPAHNDYSEKGKRIWVARELGSNVPVIMEKEKWKHADNKSILIDDYDKKINDWKQKGKGIGILHTSAVKTIQELKKLGF